MSAETLEQLDADLDAAMSGDIDCENYERCDQTSSTIGGLCFRCEEEATGEV